MNAVTRTTRNALASTLRAVPFKGRWRVARAANRLFAPEPVRVRLPETGWLHIDLADQRVSAQVYWAGVGDDDRRMMRLIRDALPPGGVFFDVGANIGIFTLAAARHLAPTGGRAVAFEPHPVNAGLLRRNVADNGAGNVAVEERGVSDAVGALDVRGAAGPGNWSVASEGPEQFRIELTTLDAYCATHGVERLDALKMDIEGCETKALRGARETLRRFRPVMFLEVNREFLPRLGSSPAEMLAEVAAAGYTVRELTRRGLTAFDPASLEGPGAPEYVNVVATPA